MTIIRRHAILLGAAALSVTLTATACSSSDKQDSGAAKPASDADVQAALDSRRRDHGLGLGTDS